MKILKFYDPAAGEAGGGSNGVAEIKTSADLLKHLNEMKSGLEKSLTEKADNSFKEKLEEKMVEINKTIEEVKGLKPEVTAEELKSVKDDLKATVKALDMVQIRMKGTKTTAPEYKDFNTALKEAMEEKTDDIAKFARKESKTLIIELKAAGEISTGNVTGSLYGSISRPGIIEPPKRKTHIRTLMPGGNIGPGNTYTFMRETGGEGNPAPVSEGSWKEQLDMDLAESSVNIETIAGWVRFTRKAMNNIPGFIAWLQSRLPEKLLRVEDAQILYGSGSTPNLKGILTAGNYKTATSSATILAEQIIDSLSQLEDEYERDATAVLVRPKEYFNFFKNKAEGSGEYDLPDNFTFTGGTLYVSGVPVYRSTALYKHDYVVGDFQMGAQFLTQEGMRLEFFEQDRDNVPRNLVTARIEETVALPVYGDNFFIKGAVPGES